MRVRLTLLALVLAVAAVAGCASNDVDPAPNDDAAPPAEATSDAPAWAAYRFDENVDPKSGRAGKIQSYGYTHTDETAGKATTLDVTVENLGVSTETVRGQSYDFSSGVAEPQTATASVEVAKLRHTLRVVEDESGELTPGAGS